MTKCELIEALKNVPDDAVVWFRDSEDGLTEIGGIRPSPLYRHRYDNPVGGMHPEYYCTRAIQPWKNTALIGEHHGVELTR